MNKEKAIKKTKDKTHVIMTWCDGRCFYLTDYMKHDINYGYYSSNKAAATPMSLKKAEKFLAKYKGPRTLFIVEL